MRSVMRSLQVLFSQIRKDMLIWWRRPVIILSTVASPIAYIFVIFFVSFTIGRNPVALVNEDPTGPQADRLAAVIQQSDEFIAHPMNSQQAASALKRMDVEAIVTIPAGFDDDLANQHATVRMQVNNVNADEAFDLRRSLPAAITTFLEGTPHNPLKIAVDENDLHSRDFTLGQFVFVPLTIFILTVAGVMCSGLIATQEWESGTINELLLSPAPRWVLVLAKILAGWAQTMVIAAIVIAVGSAFGFLRITGPAVLPCLEMLLLIGLASTGGGIALGLTFRRIGALYAYGIQIAVIMFFLSGGMSVIGFLPHIVQVLSRYVPTYYAVHALDREIFYSTPAGVGRDMLIVGAVAAATVATSIAVFRRRVLD
jgi:ABC-2 type transport system permease protein